MHDEPLLGYRGSATRNQLGHGEVGAKLAEPQRVQALAGKKIGACSCGDYFSACVSDTGVLYTWGDGSTGTQLTHTTTHAKPARAFL
jgi:alpha-tubulin suppressor-like RCC1 family protein